MGDIATITFAAMRLRFEINKRKKQQRIFNRGQKKRRGLAID